MKRFLSSILVLLALAVLARPAAFGQSDARSILVRMDSLQDLVDYETVVIEMRLFEDDREVRRRKLRLQTSNVGGERKALAVFTEPADIRGMSVLTLDSGSETDQRLYLPALRRIQRITGAKRKDRFAGSDLSFEDLRARDPADYESRILDTQPGEWVLELNPKDDDSPYSRIEAVVNSERLVIISARYFDRNRELYKVLTSGDFEEVRPGVWQANVMVMRDVQENRRTEIYYEQRDTGSEIPPETFTERQLRRGS